MGAVEGELRKFRKSESKYENFCSTLSRGVARIFQRGGHRGYFPEHYPGIADYIWFIPLLPLVYQRA